MAPEIGSVILLNKISQSSKKSTNHTLQKGEKSNGAGNGSAAIMSGDVRLADGKVSAGRRHDKVD
jgi:hypothetical protein